MHEVVVGALVRDGQVLLGRRRPTKRVNPDAWELPGGVMEAGESELAALERELREEQLPPLAHPDVRTAVVDAGDAGR